MARPGIPQGKAGDSRFIAAIRLRIRLGRRRIWLMGNRERLGLYWTLGKEIGEAQLDLKSLSLALKAEDPLGEFSPKQLGLMMRFCKAWPDEAEVRDRLGLIPWHRHKILLNRLKSPAARRRYVRRELENSWNGSEF